MVVLIQVCPLINIRFLDFFLLIIDMICGFRMICEKKYESKGLVMILGLAYDINIFGRFDAYHVFDELLEKIICLLDSSYDFLVGL